MIIPVRCFSCNKVVGSKWDEYNKLLKDGYSEKEALDKLELNKFCCRRMILGHSDIVDVLINYHQ